jgi:hypothetical protein
MAQDSRRALWVAREATEGILGTYLRMLPFVSFKPSPKDKRIRVKEYKQTRIRDGKSVRAKKYSELSFKINTRFDLFGWSAVSLLGAPVTALHTGSAGANNVQVITFAGMADNDTFYITVDGYTTAAVTYVLGTPATTGTNAASALAAIPSIAASGNIGVVASGSAGAQVLTITFQANLQKLALPTITVALGISATGSVTVKNDGSGGSTIGLGTYDSNYSGGGSGMPTLSFVYFDGVSFKQYLGASISEWGLSVNTESYLESDMKALAQVRGGSASGLYGDADDCGRGPHYGRDADCDAGLDDWCDRGRADHDHQRRQLDQPGGGGSDRYHGHDLHCCLPVHARCQLQGEPSQGHHCCECPHLPARRR